MRLLTSQLLLLEANLRAKQGKIDGLLNQRDRIISGQQETIVSLERELERCRNCVATPSEQQTALPVNRPLATLTDHQNSDQIQNESCSSTDGNSTTQLQVRVLGREQGDESLDDSDSAVVIDDDHRHSPTFTENSQVNTLTFYLLMDGQLVMNIVLYNDPPCVSNRLFLGVEAALIFDREICCPVPYQL